MIVVHTLRSGLFLAHIYSYKCWLNISNYNFCNPPIDF